MNEPISASLRAIEQMGVEAFGGTTLASDVGPTVRRVGRRRVGRVVGTGLVAAAFLATATVGAFAYSDHAVTPGGPSGAPSATAPVETVLVTVYTGDTGEMIARALEDAGVIASAADFVEVAIENPDTARRITPGTYALPRGMGAFDAMEALLDPAFRAGPTVTIPEGFTEDQIFARLNETLGIPFADLRAAAANPEAIGLPAEAKGNVEGWLGPYTYFFGPEATATEVLSAMVATTVTDLDQRGVAPSDRLRVLTIASLIEKEAGLDVDRPKVSRVIANRLAAGMALELDSTVHWATGSDGSVFTTEDDRQSDSPYNTYRNVGLPPGPICSPSGKSIDAALYPADGPWLFFVTVNLTTGETLYATTFAEHTRNVEVLQAWIRQNSAELEAELALLVGTMDADGA